MSDAAPEIHVVRNTWIQVTDGSRLAARIWMPADAPTTPVPAIVEYLPYRKSDATTGADETLLRYFVTQGYTCLRVDLRGSGDSEGIITGEYTEQEQLDGVDVVAWIAAQDWCSGSVGMIGISWGGFNGLQIAARRPPALKAIISTCSTDDRYADDIHYMGGCILGADMLSWATTMLGYNARPPLPSVVGTSWREAWLQRIEESPPFIEDWLWHQHRDEFWKNGSVCEDYDAIECPVFMVGGWADAYRNAILRVLGNYHGPRKGLIGPWSHQYPHEGQPGPAVGFLQEATRWWDRWLKGEDNGIMDEPMLTAWMPSPRDGERVVAGDGGWVAEQTWPSPHIDDWSLVLAPGRLAEAPAGSQTPLRAGSSLAHGLAAGDWLGYGRVIDTPGDQQGEDALCLTFDSDPLERPTAILGNPQADVLVASDQPTALLAVRLCDVAEDGSSTLITRGVLNLTHRDSHESPTALQPGTRYPVSVQLNAIGYTVAAGHRLRLAFSSAYWPWAWPSPNRTEVTVFAGEGSALHLPVRTPHAGDAGLRPFGPPKSDGMHLVAEVRKVPERRTVTFDVATNRYTVTTDFAYAGDVRHHDGIHYLESARDEVTVIAHEPLSARTDCRRDIEISEGDWRIRITATASMTSTHDAFLVTNEIDAFEGEVRIATKRSSRAIPRELV
ncbi:MAG: CocE/NonD family hydrolase [Humibacillus sp.]|nr:CocE/NonD family hydrolase [Humibacillus sp.]MDN5776699.1 CocE/NonD family hydrolase [Humibacillus sp.]